jgi:hypothetical protein
MDKIIYVLFFRKMGGLESGSMVIFLFLYTGKRLHEEELCHFIESWNEVPWALHSVVSLLQRKADMLLYMRPKLQGEIRVLCLYLTNGLRIEKALFLPSLGLILPFIEFSTAGGKGVRSCYSLTSSSSVSISTVNCPHRSAHELLAVSV